MKVVKAYATWCAPCKDFAITFEQAQNLLGFQHPDLVWESWNVDVVDVSQYDVTSIPTTLIFDDEGNVIASRTGNMRQEELVNFILEYV